MTTADGLDGGQKQSSTTNNLCLVCEDPASTINYGALSCLSCRTFFRRNAFPTKEVLACRYDGLCEVNTFTRKVCAPCRLRKCLSVGMSPEFIRREVVSKKKRKSSQTVSEEFTVTISPQQLALDVLDGDRRSYVSASDWTLISNIVHAFDTFNPISEVRRTIEILNMSPLLSSSSASSNLHLDGFQSFHSMPSFYNALQSFISSIPDFRILTSTEQCSLLQRNMPGLLCMGGMYLMREAGLFDRPEHEMIMLPFHGSEVIRQGKSICRQLNCDPVVFKVLFVALAFSSNLYVLQNLGNLDRDSLLLGTFRLLGSQNAYVELQWKYLMNRYDHQYSVQSFSVLIKQLLDILKLSSDMYENNRIHQNFIDVTMQQIETSSSITDQASVPLWGKK